MAVPRDSLLSLCVCVFVSTLRYVSSSWQPICPLQSASPVDNLQPRCPLSFSPNSLTEVNGYFLDKTLASQQGNVYTAVLFYASWCPFSHDARLIFEALSSMFPQIEHLAVEQASVMPRVFSRYGIHSFPTILMVHQTSRMQFRGSKDLQSLVKFYKKTTGFKPVDYVAVDQSTSSESSVEFVMRSWKGSSLNEIISREPYLLISILFLSLRLLVFLFPKLLSHFRAFWVLYVPHLNLEIFGETSQILGRVLHMISVKRIWEKLRLSKTRNFREGARSARVLASSLTSVSLGETSSLRSS